MTKHFTLKPCMQIPAILSFFKKTKNLYLPVSFFSGSMVNIDKNV